MTHGGLKVGVRVRFTMANLGASDRDALHGTTGDCPPIGAEGVVSFAHPNPKLRPEWWYVEWTTPSGRTLYVGVLSRMVEIIT